MIRTKTKLAVAAAAAILIAGASLAGEGGNGKAPGAGVRLTPNRWIKLNDDNLGYVFSLGGGRYSYRGPALMYVPSLKRFLVALGIQTRFDGKQAPCYTESTMSVQTGVWENWYPKGKNWGPKTGPAPGIAPLGKYGAGLVKGKEGILRPHLRGGAGICVWHQYCWDSHRNKAIFFAWQYKPMPPSRNPMQLLEYDPIARTWKTLAPKNSPLAPDLPGAKFNGYRPHWTWGALCYDPVNREVLLFGGASVVTERGDPGTWVYSIADNEWKKVARGSAEMNALREDAEALQRKAHATVAACRNRYYRTELKENSARKLSAVLGSVLAAKDIESLAGKLKSTGAKGHEKKQVERAAGELAAALGGYRKLLGSVDTGVDPARIRAATEIVGKLRRAGIALSSQPPPRCFSPMVFDPKTKKILLFGGNQLDRNLADTWAYDTATRTWEEHRPELSPSPRHSHGLVYLPKSRKVALVGGWRTRVEGKHEDHFALTPEAWTYDAAARKWTLVRRWEDKKLTARRGPFEGIVFHGALNNVVNMAADENDTVVLRATENTWACRLEGSVGDPAATAKHGVPPGSESMLAAPGEKRSPGWYDSAPPPDPAKIAGFLKNLPVNKWVVADEGGRQRPGYAYCTINIDPDRDQLLVWAGGHSTTHGTEITRYSLATGRWHIDYSPQIAMSYGRTLWGKGYAYGYRPWMPRHSWGSYGYDTVAKRLIIFKNTDPVSLLFNPDAGDFDRPVPQPFSGQHQAGQACATPKGLVAWTVDGLFLFEAEKRAWRKLAVKGGKLPRTSDDLARLEYDSKRGQLLFLAAPYGGKHEGKVHTYSLASGEMKTLVPENRELVAKFKFLREFRYVPSADMLVDMMGLAYDLEANKWTRLKFDVGAFMRLSRAKTAPIISANSQGLAYDPKRDLLWAVNGYGSRKAVLVMKLDATKAAASGR
ncbi:MAG: kelch repeat-containing protein [Planctomycetota bacterium]|jgi:hypothetical protein